MVASYQQVVRFCMYSGRQCMFLSYYRNHLHVTRMCSDLNSAVRISIKTYHPLKAVEPTTQSSERLKISWSAVIRNWPHSLSISSRVIGRPFRYRSHTRSHPRSQPVGHTWSSDRIGLFTSITLIVWTLISPLFFRVSFVKGISFTWWWRQPFCQKIVSDLFDKWRWMFGVHQRQPNVW